jgi:hypothetical protein
LATAGDKKEKTPVKTKDTSVMDNDGNIWVSRYLVKGGVMRLL